MHTAAVASTVNANVAACARVVLAALENPELGWDDCDRLLVEKGENAMSKDDSLIRIAHMLQTFRRLYIC